MIVQHNLMAMNSNRMLGKTTKSQGKATERLSSGFKINRAADDASGLAISEKMRKQIRGLTQASTNAQDGISAVQTAEGALTEVHDMLHRMTELAVKAANGTESDSDRNAIQAEVDQLVTEIDRISNTTKFNETYLLKGRNANGTAAKLTYTTASNNLNAKLAMAPAGGTASNIKVNTIDGTFTIAVNSKAGSIKGGANPIAAADITNLDKLQNIKYASNTTISIQSVQVGATTYYVINSTSALSTSSMAANVSEVIDAIGSSIAFASMDDLAMQIKKDLGADVRSVMLDSNTKGADGKPIINLKFNTFADLNHAMDLSLHVGADSSDDNKINMSVSMISARGLGINGLLVSGDNQDNATRAIDTIADAVAKVSSQRASLGAIQNRLEHTISNLDNIVENTTAAESEIRDTDMASQMVEYSKNQILAQAGQSMLAQANSANQGVLSLLQ
ncbi:MAG: hypothetical protein HFI94_10925 [Lachnospiraceae bacterium]|jgi:flagellin|nr:hypothetical protein [Lachnospiraceae bacterium]